MEPFEIMVSESQERMLCVCEPARLDDVLAVCARWEVHGTAIGEVTDTGAMRIFRGDELVGDMPVAALVDDCPVYELAPAAPAPRRSTTRRRRRSRAAARCTRRCSRCSPRPTSPRAGRCSSSTTGSCSRAPCAAPRRPTPRCSCCPTAAALGVSIDGNGRRVAADPYQGTIAAMLECAANLACVGAEPLGVTNNLNFGNPEKPHIAWQLDRGGARPGRRLPRPRRAGHRRQRLALQRERHRPDLPDAGHRHGRPPARRAARGPPRASRARATRSRSPAGTRAPSLAGGELAKLWGEPLPDGLPAVDLAQARARARGGARRGARRHAELAATTSPRAASSSRVAECCLAGGLGAALDLGPSDDPWCELFGERPVGFVALGPARGARRAGAARAARRASARWAATRSSSRSRARPRAGRWPSCARPTARWGVSSPSRGTPTVRRCAHAPPPLRPRRRASRHSPWPSSPRPPAMPRRARARPSAERAATSCASMRCAACRAGRPLPRPRSSRTGDAPAPWHCLTGTGQTYRGKAIAMACGYGSRGPVRQRKHAFVAVQEHTSG